VTVPSPDLNEFRADLERSGEAQVQRCDCCSVHGCPCRAVLAHRGSAVVRSGYFARQITASDEPPSFNR
jgi:hypothetical protein